jgi:hypothetical protein
MCSNHCEFVWTSLHEKCFKELKSIVTKAPILKPVDGKLNIPIWVLTDALVSGVGAWYGQGPMWDTCRPAGFLSRKFMPVQMNYCMWEQELLGVLEALLRWEDKLMGLKFTIIMDHQALTFFNETATKSQRRMHWWEYLSRFSFEIKYLKGEDNKVADGLSHYFASDTPEDIHSRAAFVNADLRLDLEADDLPIAHRTELIGMNVEILPEEDGSKARDCIEERELISQELSTNFESREEINPNLDLQNKALQLALKHIPGAYRNDKFFAEVLENHSCYKRFNLHKGLLWTTNRVGNRVVCIPEGLLKGKSLRGIILNACHLTLGHAGTCRMLGYVQHWFWWPNVAKDVEEFCISCGKCQTSKGLHQKTPGWLHSMPIPTRPWKSIGMDFSGPYPKIKGFNYILLVICRMMNMVHLIPTRTEATAKQIVELYVKEIVRLHGLPESIVSDRDTKFTSQFWMELSKLLGQ